jgi:hypothetical protein
LIHSRLRQLIEKNFTPRLNAAEPQPEKTHAKPQRKDWAGQSSKKRTILKDGAAKRRQKGAKERKERKKKEPQMNAEMHRSE